MPTLGTHVSDEIAAAIVEAAAADAGGKESRWIGEACVQRLERDGRLPGSEDAKVLAEARDLIQAIGHQAFRQRVLAAVAAAG